VTILAGNVAQLAPGYVIKVQKDIAQATTVEVVLLHLQGVAQLILGNGALKNQCLAKPHISDSAGCSGHETNLLLVGNCADPSP
jgi:hypothetical protein